MFLETFHHRWYASEDVHATRAAGGGCATPFRPTQAQKLRLLHICGIYGISIHNTTFCVDNTWLGIHFSSTAPGTPARILAPPPLPPPSFECKEDTHKQALYPVMSTNNVACD